MREPSLRADPREIVVPGDMRKQRAHPADARRRSAEPRRSASRYSEFWASLLSGAAWTGRTCLARPGEAVGSLVVLGAAAYVTLNALGFQAGRHPAPILPVATEAERSRVQAAPKLPELASAAPAARTEEPAQKTKPEARSPTVPQRDGIGEILRSAGDTTASVTPKSDKSVLKAQRALAKLGHAGIKPDGVMGPGTKAAIEKFEREHKLAVTGEPAGRTLRELTAKAGLPKG